MAFKFNPFTQTFDIAYDDSALDARLDLLEAGAFTASDVYREKLADESLNTNTTIQDDNELFFPVSAGETWLVDVVLSVYSTSTTPDFKCALVGPAGSLGNQYIDCVDLTATPGPTGPFAMYLRMSTNVATPGGFGAGAGGSTETPVLLSARIKVVTSGFIKVQWAQATSNATDVTVKAGSWLRAERVYPVSPAGANYGSFALVKRFIVGVDVAAPATSIPISNLDLDSDSNYLIKFSLKNANANDRAVSLFYNGDTTATNYYRERLFADGASATAAQVNDAAICGFPASSENCGEIRIYKPYTGGVVRAISFGSEGTTTSLRYRQYAHIWNTTGQNVISLALTHPDAGGFAANSIVEVYKWSPVSSQPLESIILAVPDNGVAITTGVAKLTFRMPYAFRLQTVDGVRGALTVAQASGSVLTFDVNKSGSSIFTTRPTFDNTEKTTKTAATPAVLNTLDLADDEEITIDVDTVGTAGALGLKVALRGRRTI